MQVEEVKEEEFGWGEVIGLIIFLFFVAFIIHMANLPNENRRTRAEIDECKQSLFEQYDKYVVTAFVGNMDIRFTDICRSEHLQKILDKFVNGEIYIPKKSLL